MCSREGLRRWHPAVTHQRSMVEQLRLCYQGKYQRLIFLKRNTRYISNQGHWALSTIWRWISHLSNSRQTRHHIKEAKSVAHDVAPLPNSHSLSLSFPPCSSFKPEGLFEYSLWPIKRGPQNLKKGTKGGPNIEWKWDSWPLVSDQIKRGLFW